MARHREEYQGPSSLASSIGQSKVEGSFGTLGGVVVGAIVGLLAHTKKMVANAKGVPDAERGLWNSLKASGRGTKAIVGALFGGLVVGTIANIRGYFRGSHKAEEGRAQFERLNTENEHLIERVEILQDELEQRRAFAEKVCAERALKPQETAAAPAR